MIEKSNGMAFDFPYQPNPALPDNWDEERIPHQWRSSISNIRKGVVEVIKVLDKWFWMIENGTTSNAIPNIHGKRYDEEYIDRFIRVIDEYFDREISAYGGYHKDTGIYTKGKEIDKPADFNRLHGPAREAFVQSVNDKMIEVGYIEE